MSTKQKLGVIIASTRPGRVGLPVADWFKPIATASDHFDVDMIDLAEVNLPFLDEPHHPSLGKYTKAHTKQWSARIEACDAFVFVTPEYNHAAPATLVNAIDFLSREWKYKPVAFVSYGGISGGTRSIETAKIILTTLSAMPIPDGVNIAWVAKHIEDGVFKPAEHHEKAARSMLGELAKWSTALATMRKS